MDRTSRGRRLGGAGVPALLLLALSAPPVAADIDEPADLGGTRVAGSTDAAHPTELTAGEWSDELGTAAERGDRHFFRYTRAAEDSTLHISVTTAGAVGSQTLDVAAEAAGNSCGSDVDSTDYGVPWAALGVELAVGPSSYDEELGREDRNSACLNQEITFEVGRGTTSSAEGDLPVSLKIVEEAPLALPADLPPVPTTDPGYAVPATGADHGDLEGGRAFADAPLLAEGTSRVEVAEGEQRFFRVPLGWGQSLSAQATAAVWDGVEGRYSGPRVEIWLYNPMRNGVDVDGAEPYATWSDDEELRIGEGTPPVRYLNRFDGDDVAAVPGDYYVSVVVAAAAEDEEPLTVPLDLAVEVADEGEEAPTYDRERAFLVAPDTWAETPSGALPDDGAGADEGSALRRVAAVALAAIGAACCVGGAVALRRR